MHFLFIYTGHCRYSRRKVSNLYLSIGIGHLNTNPLVFELVCFKGYKITIGAYAYGTILLYVKYLHARSRQNNNPLHRLTNNSGQHLHDMLYIAWYVSCLQRKRSYSIRIE